MDTDVETQLEALARLCDDLAELDSKPLRRPMAREGGRTQKEARWALRVYVCCAVGLFRDMVRAYVASAKALNAAAAFLPARMIMELCAHVTYVNEELDLK